MEQRIEVLERRVAKLAKRNHLWMVLWLATGLLVLVGAASSPDETVEAREIQLVDGDGKVRASLALREGQPVFSLIDDKGQERMTLVQDADQTALFIKDETGVTRLGAAQFAHGGGGFALHGPESKGAAVLYLKGKGSLSFFDAEGNRTYMVKEPDQ